MAFSLLVAVGLARKLWYGGLCRFWEGVALYDLIASVGYGVEVNVSQSKRNA